MNSSRVRLLWLTVVLFVLAAIPAFAANVRIVRLSLVQGDVQIDRNAENGWEQAINNMPIIGGARVYAAENAKAEIELEDGSSLRLVGPAQITFNQLSTSSKGNPVNLIQVDSGVVYVTARLRHHDDFRITGPTGEAFVIDRPSRLRFTVDEQTASLAMLDGEAVMQDGDRSAKVHSGETYNYVLGQPESAARQDTVPAEPDDSWNQQRDQYNDQYASAGAQYSGSDDPNAAGAADLGAYGTYSDIPGYGEAWQPNGVGPDWDPYAYGAWSYYPDWGWTFVSGYPWGWTPFYYGSWCYVGGGRGWWWRPGPRHGPGHGGLGGGFHPRPRWAGGPTHGWNAPHPPAARAAAGRGTVAVAGSHLNVGSIGATHGALVGRSGAIVGPSGAVVGRGGAVTSNGFVGGNNAAVGTHNGHMASPLNPGLTSNRPTIVGQKGSYSVRGSSGSNAVHRPPAGYVGRGVPGTSAPRSYGYAGGARPMSSAPRVSSGNISGGSYAHGEAVGGGAIRGAASPVMVHSGAAPSAVGGGSHGGGGFSGGGGFRGGSVGGGGFHGGGGGGGGRR